ncbi:hypothetical protein JKP88DRAFT_297319 [Tribonema minus]|uniref:Uncharacterized protein n=1 Tax=Tribonema minus TaxID=303371 RepID=A0A835ZGJ4_9STRA|nr:hypothetical protein JKP88DRAFT_323696 [Tribonema minus]KAG5190895.1 hypothetical protein JKP88DRAFT_297319 [Tribonema minus]
MDHEGPSAPPQPAGPADLQTTIRMVFGCMAWSRLLPKECWSLNRASYASAMPTVKVRLSADTVPSEIVHSLLEDRRRRLIVDLTLDGDFLATQERPLSLPRSLMRLELNGFRGKLGSPPLSLRELRICAFREDSDDFIAHPLLSHLEDGDAVQQFLVEMTDIIGAALPTLQVLHLRGLWPDDFIPIQACLQALSQLPRSHLERVSLHTWEMNWEDLVLLLSPAAVSHLDIEHCMFTPDTSSTASTVPSLPEALQSLVLSNCFCVGDQLAFQRLPESLRHVHIEMLAAGVTIEQPLPALLESYQVLTFETVVNVSGHTLPAGLRALELGGPHSQPLEEVPASLRTLKLRSYEHPLPPLPDTLEAIVLDNCTHHAVAVPDSVRSLSLYWRHGQPVPPLPAPLSEQLERLVYWTNVGGGAAGPLPVIAQLPPALRQLEANGCGSAQRCRRRCGS